MRNAVALGTSLLNMATERLDLDEIDMANRVRDAARPSDVRLLSDAEAGIRPGDGMPVISVFIPFDEDAT
jgi:hypothetical protein